MVGNASATNLVCVDGTFSRCPQTHYQLVTCHAVCHDGFSFPFVHALLPNKKKLRRITSSLKSSTGSRWSRVGAECLQGTL